MKLITGTVQSSSSKGIFYPDDNVKNTITSGDLERYTYANKTAYVGTQTSPYGCAISADGLSFYAMSTTNIYQYTLSTAFDLSTASYANKTLAFNSYEATGQGMQFSNDGVNLYINGYNSDRILQYILSTPWDINTAVFYGLRKQFSINVQDTSPVDVVFGDSGTKLYVTGDTNDKIYQYTLSTPYEITTASYSNKSYTLTTHVANLFSPLGLTFKPDGTRFYVSDAYNDKIYQFDCVTPWDISTARFMLPNISVGTQEGNPHGLYIGDSGTKMYVLGYDNDTIYQYTLGTAYDVSTATYASKSFSVTNQDTVPLGLTFKPDGTRFYVSGQTNDRIYEYECTTAWDISTARHQLPESSSLASQESLVTGMDFKSDGTAVYVIGTNNKTIYQYTLSTAYDVSTASYASKSFSVNAQDTAPRGIKFKDDGTKVYVMGDTNDRIYQYSLGTAWDISTASYDSKSFLVSGQDSSGNDLHFKSDGTKMYMLGDTNNRVYEYTLSTAWDVSTATSSTNVAVVIEGLTGLSFNSDGTSFYVIGTSNDIVYQYVMSTAWLVSSATLTYQTRATILQDGSFQAINFNSNGTKIFLLGDATDKIYQYDVSTAYTMSTMNVRYIPISSTAYEARDVEFSSDGTKMLVATYYASGTDYIQQYDLAVAWNVSTAVGGYYLTSPDALPEGIRYNSDGTKLYVLGNSADKIYEYTLSPAWTLNASSTLVSMNNPAYLGFQDGDVTAFHFNNTGTRMYLLGNTNNLVWQYTLEVAWSIDSLNIGYCSTYGTAWDSYGIRFKPDGTRFFQCLYGPSAADYILQGNLTANPWNICSRFYPSLIGSPDLFPTGIAFKPDGTRMYISGGSSDRIYEYTLSTAWDLASTLTQVTHNNATYIGNFETNPYGIDFSADGTKMIMVGRDGGGRILQFELTTPWIMESMNIGYKSLAGQEGLSYGMTISYDGSKVYIIGSNDTIYQYSLTTPFNLGSFVYDSKSLSINAVVPDGRDIFVDKTGTKIYIVCQTNDRIYQYNMSTPFDITTATYSNKSIYISHIDATPEGLTFSQNFERMIMAGRSGNNAYQFNLNI